MSAALAEKEGPLPSPPVTPRHADRPSVPRPAPAHNVCQRILGRYALYGEVAHGGMATVHFGRLLGPVGFSRTVAIKRLHPQYAKDPDFVSMFLDEARLAARIRHPNVVTTLDIVALEGELFLVMEYVQGETLSRLIRRLRETEQKPPPGVALAIMAGVLSGLHAAHEATNERGEPLELVHRDMSPQNVIVCVDGIARVLDFGIAKATGRVQTTREGQLKGKLSYIAPEQLQTQPVDRRTDVYAAAVTLWEVLTGQRLFKGDSEWQIVNQIISGELPPPSTQAPELTPAVDAIVMKGLARNPADRYATARDMAMALEQAMPLASARQVGEWVESLAGEALRHRKEVVGEIETNSSVMVAPVPVDTPSSPGLLGSDGQGDRVSAPPTRTASGSILVAETTSTTATGSAPAAMARAIAGRESHPSLRDVRIPPPGRLPSIPDHMGTGLGSGSFHDTGSSVMASQRSLVPPPLRRRRRSALALGVLFLGAGVAALLFMVAREGRRPIPWSWADIGPAASGAAAALLPAEPAKPPVASPIDLPRALPAPPVVEQNVAVEPPVQPVLPQDSSAPIRPAREGAGVGFATAPRPAAVVKAAPVAAASAPTATIDECAVPYTIDEGGIRHPKPECM